MFCLNLNTLLLILLNQYLTEFTHAVEENRPKVSSKSDSYGDEDCSLWAPEQDDLDTPVALTSNSNGDSIVCPTEDGRVSIKQNSKIKLSCGTGEFASAAFRNTSEINVKCVKKDTFEHDGQTYSTKEIKCESGGDERQKLKKKECSKYSIEYLMSRDRTDIYNCLLWVPSIDYNVPIPFTTDRANPKIILPDANGNIVLKPNATIKLTCSSGDYFQLPLITYSSEILIKCINKTYLEYDNKLYTFDQFKCLNTPRATLRVTNATCHHERGNIVEVGFDTTSVFLLLYNICYDMLYKNALYSWYTVQSPFSVRRQNTNIRPDFEKESLFDTMYKDQRRAIERILCSKKIIKNYIKHNEFLTRGHLIARTEFYYVFEQQATFFYENTAPQWYTFNEGIWKSLEKFFRRLISKDNSRHLVITGTHGNSTLGNQRGVQRPLFLILPDKLRVPLFIWKMDFNMEKKVGLVFIGMNNPYKKIDRSAYICGQIPCPDNMVLEKNTTNALVYCCSKKSFERAHGKIDEIVYQQKEVKIVYGT